MTSIAGQLSEKITYLRVREVEGILRVLIDNSGISSRELIQMTGLPKETLRDFKATAAYLLKESDKDSIYIRDEYLEQLKGENPQGFRWSLLTFEEPRLVASIEGMRKKHMLEANRELDQFFATAQTTVNKALIVREMGLATNQKIAVLGDDDLVSIGLGLLPNSNARVTALDTDKSLLNTIATIAKELNTASIQCVEYDVRSALPQKIAHNFDVVITDPPYTKTGIQLFLNRSIELLGITFNTSSPDKYIFLYYGTSRKTPEKTLKIQEIITQMGLVIENRIDKFARYNGAESIGDASALYVLKTTLFTRPLELAGDYSLLYTHTQAKEEKFPYVDHVVAKVYAVPNHIINSKSALLKALGELCSLHKLKVVDEKITRFSDPHAISNPKKGGMTITYVLANSNLVVHTWPEHNAIHFDLITCAPIYGKERLVENIAKVFGTKSVELRYIE